MKRRLKIWSDAVSYFFNFRKPAFREFNCIDLVAGNKLLFLLAWDIKNARFIKLNPGRHVYRQRAGAAVVTLLPGTSSVDIVIANCWRRSSMTILLKHIALDKQSLAALTTDLRLFSPIAVEAIQPDYDSLLPAILLAIPAIQRISCQININPSFNYQNFTPHEP